MKKILYSVVLVLCLLCISLKVYAAMPFKDAFEASDSKPMLVFIYANWAENYQTYLDKFRGLEKVFGDTFNYVELDIASPDTKEFNTRYHIYPNLPYILMFRNNGKISRYIQRNCAASESCMVPRIKSFIL